MIEHEPVISRSLCAFQGIGFVARLGETSREVPPMLRKRKISQVALSRMDKCRVGRRSASTGEGYAAAFWKPGSAAPRARSRRNLTRSSSDAA